MYSIYEIILDNSGTIMVGEGPSFTLYRSQGQKFQVIYIISLIKFTNMS